MPNIAPWETLLTGIALFAFWCIVIAIVSVIGGWYRLSKMYPAEETTYLIVDESSSKRYRWASLVMGPPFFPTNYGNCVNVVVNDQGIRVAVGLLFRTLHTPFFIPWSAVQNCTLDRQFSIFTRTTIEVAGSAHPLRFYGNCAREIERVWESRASAREATVRGDYVDAERG